METLITYYTQVLCITFIVVNHLFELYLYRRQLTTLHEHRSEVPSEFHNFLTLADHQKAISYATAKLGLGQFKLVWNAILLFYWFPFRGAEKLYLALPGTGTHREVFFLVAFMLIQGLLNLPWSIYSTFVMEQRFGFNRSTPKLFIIDRLKGLLLGLLLGVPLLYGILLIYQGLGKWWWFVSFLFVTAFQFALVWLYPTVIAPLFNKFKPLEGEELKSGIENLVTNAGFNAKEVFVMDASKRSSHGNAYFTGFGKNKRVVFFDTLLNGLKTPEILAILAHELGHMKLKHIPKSLITSLILSFLGFGLMGVLASTNWFYSGHFIRVISPGVLFLLFTQAVPIYTFWFEPIGTWISRKREFEADAYAAGETKAEDLISGLLKLYKENASPVVTDKIYSGFYHSHPPALERIKRLESLK
ncbi:MAG: M48 family metallopeptidase [Bacteriovoracaceae bacterium]|nr:M48 family metallopeptidase [Bacteriovoracaceae bacterium]